MMQGKKTVVIGASPKPERYSNMAMRKLKAYGHEVVPIGLRNAEVDGMQILTGKPEQEGIHTFTLYLNAGLQKDWYDYILEHDPKRIILNPGAGNPELERLAAAKGIEVLNACTLVMLSSGQY